MRLVRAAALLLPLLLSCRGIVEAPDDPDAPAAIASLRLDAASVTVAVGQTAQVTATLVDENGQPAAVPEGRAIQYASSDAQVFTVSPTGLITGVAAGTGVVRASFGALAIGAPVTVLPPGKRLEIVSGNAQSGPPSAALPQPLRVRAVDETGARVPGLSILFAPQAGSVDPGEATTDANGEATTTWTLGAALGAQTLVGSASDFGTVTFTATATPRPITSVSVAPATNTLTAVAQTVQLAATARNDLNEVVAGATFTWTTSNPAVATVSQTGLVTAVANGTATITATTGSVSGTASVTVNIPQPPPVVTVTVAPATATLTTVGQTQQFTASALDGNGQAVPGATFTWASSNTGVATVSPTGLVTAVANGTATITATSGAVQGTAAVTVTLAPARGVLDFVPDSLVLVSYSGGPPFLAAVDVRDSLGGPDAGLGTLSCTPFFGEGGPWFQLVRCGQDSIVVRVDPVAFGNGTDRGGVTVTGTNADTSFFRIRMTAFPPSIAFSPDSVAVTVSAGGAAQRVAANITTRTLVGAPTYPESNLGALTCSNFQPPAGAPTLTIVSCGDSLVVNVGSNASQGTYRMTVLVDAPNSTVPVNTGFFWINVTVGIAPQPTGWKVGQVFSGNSSCAMDSAFAGVGGLPSELYCWGANSSGQLGIGVTGRRLRPTKVVGVPSGGFRYFRMGRGVACGVDQTSTLLCWGAGGDGANGDGGFANQTRPTIVTTPGNVWQVAPGGPVTCIIMTSSSEAGQAYCWGSGFWGLWGYGQQGTWTTGPTQPVSNYLFNKIAVGYSHACGLTPSGLVCWGQGIMVGSNVNSSSIRITTPRAVVGGPGPAEVAQLEAGEEATCARTFDGVLWCWGGNGYGTVGNGDGRNYVGQPTIIPMPNGLPVIDVAMGTYHTCALTSDGTTYCWGRNDNGQLGTGATGSDQWSPVQVNTTARFTDIGSSGWTTCARDTDGIAWCWGYGLDGDIGNLQDSNNALVPTKVERPFAP